MATTRSGIYPASFVGATTLDLTQIGAASVDMGNSLTEIIPGGALDRAAVVTAFSDPSCRITTRDLATYFGAVSASAGFNCTSGATFRYQQRAVGGAFSGSTNNYTLTSTLGFLCPETLSASQDGREGATLESKYWPLYDGSTASVVATASVDLSAAPAPAFSSVFYLGPVYINSVQLEGLISTRVNFGIDFKTVRSDGLSLAKHGSVMSRRPSFAFTFLKQGILAANIVNLFGATAGGTIAAYFQKGVNYGQRVAAATTSHCKISATSGMMSTGAVSVSGEDDTTFTLTVIPTSALAVSVASAIP